ncbi:MAG TPA: restriction endonuclease subunit S [Dermatophilaceae bacterium]|nr:restriction endonuclease subunit S [Dermatophilaceae bacterium]
MSDWYSRPLGDLITLQRGFDITRDQQARDGAVPVVSSGGISSYHDTAMANGPGVVIGRKGTLGRVHFVDVPYWPHDTTLWVKDFKGNDPRFVYYALMMLDTEFLNVGSASPTLNRNHLHPLPVSWPSLPEQRAIAEVLGALDDKIAANTTLVQVADALAGSLTRRALSSARVPLREVAALTMGSSPPGTSYNEEGNGAVFYQGVRDFGVRFPQNRVWTDAPVRMAAKRDTLVSVRAPVGRTNLAAEETCIGRGLAGVHSRSGHAMSLFHLLRDDPTVWEPFEAEGTVFGSINKHQLEGLLVPVVAAEAADSLESQLLAVEGRIAAALAENVALAKARDELLPLLMSGKVRVKDAEKVVEGVV